MVATMAPIQVDDIRTLDDQRNPVVVAGAELGGIRTVLNVPMLKENSLVGAFIVSRQEVRPFSDKQIELDILVVPHALGQRVTFVEGEGPRLDALKDPAALQTLRASVDHAALEPVSYMIAGQGT
jgi:hypothetical protein